MKTIALALTIALAGIGCASSAQIKASEKACLASALASLKVKVAAGVADPKQSAIQLTEQELNCALEALFSK